MPRAVPEKNNAPRGEAGDFEEIEVPNKLRDKVGPGYGADPVAVEKADAIVENLKVAYEARLEQEIQDLLLRFKKMTETGAYDLDLLHDLTHEIRGEAGTFGYDLVSDIGKLLCELLSPMGEVSVGDARAISTHLKAMHTVVTQKIKGAGPEVAKEIVKGLTTIVEKSRN
jgi:hypothetical protein